MDDLIFIVFFAGIVMVAVGFCSRWTDDDRVHDDRIGRSIEAHREEY